MTGRAFRLVLACSVMFLCGCSLVADSSPDTPSYSPAISVYDDYDDMSRALGYEMVQIAGGGFIPSSYSIIDGRIGEIIYTQDDEDAGEAELNLRSTEGTGDITGVGGVVYRRIDMHGCEVQIGSYRNIQAAQFTIDNHTYAMSATGMTTKVFETIVGQVVEQLAAV